MLPTTTCRATALRRRAFTLVELFAIVIAIGIVGSILLHGLGCGKARVNTGQLKDKTQVRGIIQSAHIFAQQNNDNLPLPSRIDFENTTTAAQGMQKDTTANMFSKLIFDGFIPPEILFSSTEVNANITEFTTYEFEKPSAAVNPDEARWDPAFRADFRDTNNPGGVSYAHLELHNTRLKNWKNTFNATTAQIGNRGPEVTTLDLADPSKPDPVYASETSNTYEFMGSRLDWQGVIGFADGHAETMNSIAPNSIQYEFKTGARPDVLFYDELDDEAGLNAFLSIFVDPGVNAERPLSIWD